VPRKTAKNTAKHRGGGVGSVVANHRGGGESSVVVTTLVRFSFFHTNARGWLGAHLRSDLFCVEWDVKP